jgi:peptide/nickel transport system permease protein
MEIPLQSHRRRSETQLILGLVRRDTLTMTGIVIIGLFILVAVLAPFLAPYPAEGAGVPNPPNKFLPPSAAHWFGTDYLGRDILSRIILGSQISLTVAVVVIALAIAIGTPLGAIAGYLGGRIDEAIMRVTDVFLSFPSLLLAIILLATLGPGLTNAMISLSLTWWPWYTRIMRAQAVSLRERTYIEAAKVVGVSDFWILLRHILPNAITPILVQGTMDMSSAILAEAGLSFIGLGAQAPSPEWGLMISTGRIYILNYWWFPTFPGLAIFAIAVAFNLLGDGLREILDPKTRRFIQA